MNYNIFNDFPSNIIIIRDEKIIYVNKHFVNLFNITLNDHISTTNHKEFIDFCINEIKAKMITINNVVFYIRAIIINNDKMIEIQNMNMDTCNLIINNFSQEVRSPIHGITGIIEILSSTSLNSQQKEYIKMVKDCSIDLLHIINNIIDYIKITENRFKLICKKDDINQCIEQTKIIIQSMQSNNNISYDITTFDNEYLIDSSKLQQVIINLMMNAIENTDEGNITLSIKKLIIDDTIDNIIFKISDTGIGIKEEDMNKIFKPFCKIRHNSSHNRIGLGMTISKYIIETMNGTINIKSEYQQGTTILYTIPFEKSKSISNNMFENKMVDKNILVISDNSKERFEISSFIIKNKLNVVSVQYVIEANTVYLTNNYQFDYIIINQTNNNEQDMETFLLFLKQPNYTHTKLITINNKLDESINIITPIDYDKLKNILYTNIQTPKNKAKYILIVEDQISNQMILTKYLQNMNYKNIDIASNGQDAVTRVMDRSRKYDLILMDIMMPVMDGIESSKQILKIDNTHIIICISADISTSREQCDIIGIKELISKPVTYKTFKSICEKYL